MAVFVRRKSRERGCELAFACCFQPAAVLARVGTLLASGRDALALGVRWLARASGFAGPRARARGPETAAAGCLGLTPPGVERCRWELGLERA